MDNNKVSLQELASIIAKQSDYTKNLTEDFLRELMSVIQEYIEKDGVVKVKGLGTFKSVWIEPRKSVDVNTKQEIILEAHYRVSFTPEQAVKDSINNIAVNEQSVPTEGAQVVRQAAVAEQPSTIVPPVVLENTDQSSSTETISSDDQLNSTASQDISTEQEPTAQQPIVVETENSVSAAPLSTESEVISKEEKNVSCETEGNKNIKKSNATIFSFCFLAVVIIVGLVYYFYFGGESIIKLKLNGVGNTEQVATEIESSQAVSNDVVEIVEEDNFAQETESVAETINDSTNFDNQRLVCDEPIVESTEAIEPIEIPEDTYSLDNYTYTVAQKAPIKGTETVIDGSRLTMVAYRAYGEKIFWVYIYDANRHQLSSPSKIEKGMVLNIPDLPMTLVDKNNPDCINKAKQLSRKYD